MELSPNKQLVTKIFVMLLTLAISASARHGTNKSQINTAEINNVGLFEPKIGYVGFEVSWLSLCIASFAALGLACTHIAGKKNDTPILCNNFNPISYSKSDNQLTIKEIDVHNKTWECFCITGECQKGGKYYQDK